jgi:uncharacterized membrane protein
MVASQSSSEDAAFLDRLRQELEQWQREGLLRRDQVETLLGRYGLLPGETPRTLRRSRIANVVAVLGAVLVGVGVILLIGANWQYMSKWIRLALLICATAGCYHAGYRMAFQSRTYPKVGMALLLLGSLLWGASIFLIGQMYHAGSGGAGGGETAAVFYWFIGVLPLAYILLSQPHMGLSLMLGTVWLGMILKDANRAFDGVIHTYTLFGLALGIFLYAFGRLHSTWRTVQRLDASYRWFGLTCVFAALYAFSFKQYWYAYGMNVNEQCWLWLGVLVAGAGAAILGLLLTQARGDRIALYEVIALSCLLVLSVGIAAAEYSSGALAPSYSPYYDLPYGASDLLPVALFNLLLLGAVISVIALGWARNQPGLATLGVFVFYVHVVTRYFDLLGGMLSSGLMFVGAGLLLLLLGVGLERSRRRLLDVMAARRGP